MKTESAWAILNQKGNLELFDSRCPIYWHKKIAIQERDKRKFTGKVVEIKIITP